LHYITLHKFWFILDFLELKTLKILSLRSVLCTIIISLSLSILFDSPFCRYSCGSIFDVENFLLRPLYTELKRTPVTSGILCTTVYFFPTISGPFSNNLDQVIDLRNRFFEFFSVFFWLFSTEIICQNII
jgi:hypothetical protein